MGDIRPRPTLAAERAPRRYGPSESMLFGSSRRRDRRPHRADGAPRMNSVLAGVVVFFTSAAILVLEILALRLLAPYVGVTLQTYTATIATVLAGIAAGTWIGGYAADRIEPRRLLGPLMVVGGGLSLAAVPAVRVLGASGTKSVIALSLAAFFAPAAVLSAVSPTVVKLQLRELRSTGRVVGRISALGTLGAISGTYLAGFVLLEATSITTSILGIGSTLMASGTVLWLWLWRNRLRVAAAVAVVGFLGSNVGAALRGPCDVETTYHCAKVIVDPTRPGGRLLVLDAIANSYVDLDEPTYLEFPYAQVFADVISTAAPAGPLRALHVGGGGFSFPRYLAATRPGSSNTVLELDPGLVRLSTTHLGLRMGPDLQVRVGDARVLIGSFAGTDQDVVVGDAFAGLAVPWHLTTAEFVSAVRATLRPGGAYVLNLIDYPPLRFARAEIATLAAVFEHVALVAPVGLLAGDRFGNIVLVASDDPIDSEKLATAIAARGGIEEVRVDTDAARFAGDSNPLTDERAPVDQWLTRARGS